MDQVTDKNVDAVLAREAYASADAMIAEGTNDRILHRPNHRLNPWCSGHVYLLATLGRYVNFRTSPVQ